MRALVTFVICLEMVFGAELPTDIQKCRYDEGDCIKNAINLLIRRYPKGLPKLGISPFNDFRPGDLQLFEAPQVGSMWLNFKLINQVINGCENATVTHVSGFQQDPTKAKVEIGLRIPRLVHRSQYKMQMRWLSMVQTNTTGPCYAEFQNVSLTLNLKVIVRYRQEKRYLKIYELMPKVELGRFFLELGDLYQHNLDLTLVVNRFYRENWLALWNDIEPKVSPSFSRSGAQLLNNIFDTISYDDMFL
ncbi:circadian clock-controlled protein daywake-like [Drosophila montana]|uniref:circadian clock-controlled protein daywake-like n=1 Tax=Drosophila montana TaxID=40370 RepID=UPI00313B8634